MWSTARKPILPVRWVWPKSAKVWDGLEEDVEQNFLVDEDQRVQFMGKRKNKVKVTDRQKFRLLCLQPLVCSRRTALGTVSIAARVENGTFKATGIASVQMTAQSLGPAHLNRVHDFAVSGW